MTDDIVIERQLWEILMDETNGECDRMIRLAEKGCQRLPAHREQITNIIAHWRNEGYVRTAQADTQVVLANPEDKKDDTNE